jgi:hypothetical protein
MIVYGIRWKCEKPFQATDTEEPKLVQLDKVLLKWCTAMRSEQKPVTVPMITEKTKSFCDEKKVTSKYTSCERCSKKNWVQNKSE